LHLLDCVEGGRRVDGAGEVVVRVFGGCAAGVGGARGISEYEHAVKAGSYESLIEAQYKFDLMETDVGGECRVPRRIGSG